MEQRIKEEFGNLTVGKVEDELKIMQFTFFFYKYQKEITLW